MSDDDRFTVDKHAMARIDWAGGPYLINFASCSTPAQAMRRIVALAERKGAIKEHMTPLRIARLAQAVMKAKGWA
ncbi:hypothetical protein KHP62_04645 [Rhodobacteraceae bacterium NNCM2]|nr:hypothetical protein [Coraliihabitans acroporae]